MEESTLPPTDVDNSQVLTSMEMEEDPIAAETNLPIQEELQSTMNDNMKTEENSVTTEVNNAEVIELKAQLEHANQLIQSQEALLASKTAELSTLQEKMNSIHMDELIQLYLIQKQENSYLKEETERVYSLLSDKKQTDSNIKLFQENASDVISSVTSLVQESFENHSILNNNYTHLQQSYQNYQTTTETLVSELQAKLTHNEQQLQVLQDKITELTNQNESLSEQLISYQNQGDMYKTLFKEKSAEFSELQKKYQLLEEQLHQYSLLEKSQEAVHMKELEEMNQKVNDLMNAVESNSHYKTRLEEIMKIAEREEMKERKQDKQDLEKEMKEDIEKEEVKEEVNKQDKQDKEVKEEDLEKEVVQLKQEKALLLLDLKEISNQLEEKIPSFHYQQKCLLQLQQNYKQLLLLWNSFVATSLDGESPAEPVQLMQVELDRQKQENLRLTNQITSLETLLTQFKQLLINRGNTAIPEIEGIFADYQKQVMEVQKEVEELKQVKQSVEANNLQLTANIKILQSEQLLHNNQVNYYSKKVEGLQKELKLVKSQLQATFQQFDHTKLDYLLLIGKYIQMSHSIKKNEIMIETEKTNNSLKSQLETLQSVFKEIRSEIEKNKTIEITISPPDQKITEKENTILQGVSLSEKIENLESQTKELEETMQEMEEEANDMNRTIEISENKNKELEKENLELKSTIQQLRGETRKTLEISSLGNPFHYSTYSLNEELAAIQETKQHLENDLQLEREAKLSLQSEITSLQQVLSTFQENEGNWKTCLESIKEVFSQGSFDTNKLLFQICLLQLTNNHYNEIIQNLELKLKEKPIPVVTISEVTEVTSSENHDNSNQLRTTVNSLEKSLPLLQADIQAKDKSIQQLSLTVKKLTETKEQIQQQLNTSIQEVSTLRLENDQLQQLNEAFKKERLSEKRDGDEINVEIPDKQQRIDDIEIEQKETDSNPINIEENGNIDIAENQELINTAGVENQQETTEQEMN